LKKTVSVFWIIVTAIVFTASSCVPRKKSAYFQSELNATIPEFKLTLNPGDILAIHVTTQEPELAVPFNPYAQTTNGQATGYSNGIAAANGYLIDNKGNIQFPVLGTVALGGLKHSDAVQLLENKLTAYLKNPIVSIRIQNFRVTLLGDVKNPGSFIIPNEKITFLEAVALAGDLNLTARRDNILLLRTNNGKKQSMRIDFTSQDIFANAEAYYLQQGDVIYIEPNRAQRNSSGINNRLGVVISVFTLFVTTLTLILN
jgi:polysaccharide export outer membrane protein